MNTPDPAKIKKVVQSIAGSPRSMLDRLHRTESYIEATDSYKLLRVFGTFDPSPEDAKEYPNTDAIIPTEEPLARVLVDAQFLADIAKALLAVHKAQKNKKKGLVWLEIPPNFGKKTLCLRSHDGLALALIQPVRQ